jgi:hypothetical protein
LYLAVQHATFEASREDVTQLTSASASASGGTA